ncbi:Ig-like domain-containing protein [Croceitalea sp. MTPC9]|uniref:Ig-like domain-containing protein n=1 Tax=unclassified Croceitalea TaxID=2632280 RepID=UPI002B38CEB5|nr:Ig-like domain-containing protein [Croceitalea sp. MTPC6]GMN16838.1 Ig-like domain-containing protein [Croceitalea sp. MTPC9]
MPFLKKIFSLLFLFFITLALWQCARRGTPSGGDKDITPPVLLKTDPENLSINFDKKKIKLYFDEYIKLQDVQNQLVVSPPLKYIPEIKPQGVASKFIEITFKDTLRENTTYTINFGQSIVDNNEGNPNSFLSYVFSTGDYIDSLSLTGAIKDAYKRSAEQFVSVMLYEIDSIYNDSTIYKYPPNYITNTLDSLPLFSLKNLKAGEYALVAIKDEGKNNVFDQRADKIGFLTDTIRIPTDSIYLLNLFKENPDYSISVPSYVAKNHIIFGYQGSKDDFKIETLTSLPDSVKTLMTKNREKDTIDYWLTPTDLDSIIFTITNEKKELIDTFTVKTRKLPSDSLQLAPSHRGKLNFEESFHILANTPIIKIDTTKIAVLDKDTLQITYKVRLDSIINKVDFDFELTDNQKYNIVLLPGAIEDFFGLQNDTLVSNLSTGSYADYGNLSLSLSGEVTYPVIVELTDEKGEKLREIYAEQPKTFEFNNLEPKNYGIRIIFDENKNGKWDTGNYLKKIQPEVIKYYPDIIEIRANWEKNETFVITN